LEEVSQMKVVIVGAGRVGLSLASMLKDAGGYEVRLVDCTDEALSAARSRGMEASFADAARRDDVRRLLAGADVLVAAVPDRLVPALAQAAANAGIHYLDFSEAGDETISGAAGQDPDKAFLTGCGVSPGLVDAVAYHLALRFDPGCDLDVRVGAIPARRGNRLGYGVIWNLDGLIAEYTEPCSAIVDGRRVELPALSGLVGFAAGGVDYEAFHTAGALDALQGLVSARARNLTFRTIRYPGHLDYMQFLLDDLDLRSRRDLLTTVLRNGLPLDGPDALVIQVKASGARGGAPAEAEFCCRIEPKAGQGGQGALTLASAAHAATLIEMLRTGELHGQGLRQCALTPHETIFCSAFFAPLTSRMLEAA